MELEALRKIIKEANAAYRKGNAIISDEEYDNYVEMLEELSPNDDLLNQIGFEIEDDSRKERLPMQMRSMNKVKTYAELHRWLELKGIPKTTELVITPKYDGISFCVEEDVKKAWTRGDGVFGQRSDEHYKTIGNSSDTLKHLTFGEVMMPRGVFAQKYSTDFKNPRNMVAGQINNKEPQKTLADLVYIRYGIGNSEFPTKSAQLEFLNKNQGITVPFFITTIDKLSEDSLLDLFNKLNTEFELDGLIIEVNDESLRTKLGRETSTGNPCFARAYKGAFEQVEETEVIGISWNISKQGLLKPILHIKPIQLDGVTVSNVTGNNAKFVKDNGIGIGSMVKVKRSGMVIPLIVAVTKTVEFQTPTIEGVEVVWNEAGIELMTLTETDEQRFKQLVSFFEILEVENVSEGIIKQLWEAGYTNVADILKLQASQLNTLEGFGKRKAEIVYNAIHDKMKNVELSKLQHATGFFKGLGSKKLALLEHFESKPSVNDIVSIEGFAETSALSYLEGLDKFHEFVKDLPITLKKTTKVESLSSELSGQQFVFTGVRRADLEVVIAEKGGVVGSGVSKRTTYLVMKEVGSGSSKEQKALELGVKVITVQQLESMLS
jgi:NAD-dependent DNA ligase